MQSDEEWEQYFEASRDRPPRPDFVHAVATLDPVPGKTAVDLGAGSGIESRYLLDHGWDVFAVDGTPGLRNRVIARLPTDPGDRLVARDALFSELDELPTTSFVYAGVSLPFTSPAELRHILDLVVRALTPDGLFIAHFFGVDDDWAARRGVVTHTPAALSADLAAFDVIHCEERQFDGPSGRGMKHWHLISITARSGVPQPRSACD